MVAFGNIPVPGVTVKDEVLPGDILASYARLIQKGGTFVLGATSGPDSDGILPAGTVVGRVTSSGKFAEYDDGNSPAGVGVAVGVLRETIDVSESDVLGNIIFGGVLKYSKLVGIDANAIADLNGRVDTNRDYFIF